MASYISIPRDLTKVKTKVFFNLTKRQIICFGLGALFGVPLFFILKVAGMEISNVVLCMMAVMLPFFLFAMYEKNGQPLEKILKQKLNAKFLRPKVRLYRTNNYYACLARQAEAEREVKKIVISSKGHIQKKKANT